MAKESSAFAQDVKDILQVPPGTQPTNAQLAEAIIHVARAVAVHQSFVAKIAGIDRRTRGLEKYGFTNAVGTKTI